MRMRELAALPFLGLAYLSLRIARLIYPSMLIRMGWQKTESAMREVLHLYPFTSRGE